jgi:Kef-type K+ transport system membrane component KefB
MGPSQAFLLLLVALAALVLPGVSRLLRLPGPVVEIICGVILGKSVLHLEFGGEWLPFLAHLGFLFLMLHAGMEIDFGMLLKQSRSDIILQFALFAATLSLALIAAAYLRKGFFLALVLTTTSLGLVMPTLKELNLTRTPLGQGILVAASLADFLTLFGITFLVLWNRYGVSWRFALPLPLFVGFAVLLWAGRLWAWWNPRQAERLLATQDPQEVGVRLSLALLFLLVALSELVHLEPALGAFLGGCLLAFVFREKTELEQKLSALGFGFLIPIFFIHVGMQFDLRNVLGISELLFAAKLLVLAFAVKVLPSLILTIQRTPLRSALRAGCLLASRLSLIVAAATIGAREGFLTPELKDAIVLLALLTCVLGPTLFKLTERGEQRDPPG